MIRAWKAAGVDAGSCNVCHDQGEVTVLQLKAWPFGHTLEVRFCEYHRLQVVLALQGKPHMDPGGFERLNFKPLSGSKRRKR